jgi:hypothetical protein
MGSGQLFIIGKTMNNARIKGDEDLYTRLNWFYKKYQKVHLHDKQRIWQQYLDYCRIENVDITEELLDERYKKAC